MKSLMKRALRVVPAAQVQLSLAMDGVLRDVRHAFYRAWASGVRCIARCEPPTRSKTSTARWRTTRATFAAGRTPR